MCKMAPGPPLYIRGCMHARHGDACRFGDAGVLELQALVLLGAGAQHRGDAVLLRLRLVHRPARGHRPRDAGSRRVADCTHVAPKRVPAQHAVRVRAPHVLQVLDVVRL